MFSKHSISNKCDNMADEKREYQHGKILQRSVEREMRTSYLDYAMSVIVGRALPDVARHVDHDLRKGTSRRIQQDAGENRRRTDSQHHLALSSSIVRNGDLDRPNEPPGNLGEYRDVPPMGKFDFE